MNIYSQYVYPDKLISPINGYSCRIISKQTINKFGFSSKEELLEKYPGFPLCCEELKHHRSKNHFDPNIARSEELQRAYEKKPRYCVECDTELSYSKRHNKFCDSSCAAKHNNKLMSVESRLAQRKSLKLTNENRPIVHKIPAVIEKCCTVCGSSFDTRRRSTKTCSNTCKNSLLSVTGRKSAAKRVVRSKDEIELFELCVAKYKCFPNQIIAEGWDADIVLPDHKIAILWNGPWHYKEMNMNNHSLKQVQTRDRIKTSLFESLGWTVLVYEDRSYTPTKAFEHIQSIIG